MEFGVQKEVQERIEGGRDGGVRWTEGGKQEGREEIFVQVDVMNSLIEMAF